MIFQANILLVLIGLYSVTFYCQNLPLKRLKLLSTNANRGHARGTNMKLVGIKEEQNIVKGDPSLALELEMVAPRNNKRIPEMDDVLGLWRE